MRTIIVYVMIEPIPTRSKPHARPMKKPLTLLATIAALCAGTAHAQDKVLNL